MLVPPLLLARLMLLSYSWFVSVNRFGRWRSCLGSKWVIHSRNVISLRGKLLARTASLKCVGPARGCHWINQERSTWEQHNAPFSLSIILVGIASSFIWLCREKATASASLKKCCGSRSKSTNVNCKYFIFYYLSFFIWFAHTVVLTGADAWTF